MDPDLIRLILVILGVLLVVGIYLWDRFKRAAPKRSMVRRLPPDELSESELDHEAGHEYEAEPSYEAHGSAMGSEVSKPQRREPRVDTVPESVPGFSARDVDQFDAEPVGAESARRSALDPEPADVGTFGAAAETGDPQFSMDLNFDAHGDNDYLSTDPALYDEVERKIIVLHIVAKGGDFRGSAIEKACDSMQLRLGDMSIYHRHDGVSGKVLFSLASMVEPGNFPAADMDGFSTPGLSMFTQLPGAKDGLQIFEDMLVAGKRLASLLQGELQDDRHNKLTRQMEKHLAESVIEHRRRLNIARSRH